MSCVKANIQFIFFNLFFSFLFSHQDSDVRQDEMASFLEEAMIMKDFHHHNVLSLHGVAFMSDERPYVLLPFMEKGDLKHYIADENNVSIETLSVV